MRKQYALLVILLAFSAAAQADVLPGKSLFFLADEVEKVEALNRGIGHAAPVSPYDIRLDAIIYYAPDRWTLWLQNERWTPERADADIKILSVSENEVRLLWQSAPGDAAKKIALKPHQIFRAASGRIFSTED